MNGAEPIAASPSPAGAEPSTAEPAAGRSERMTKLSTALIIATADFVGSAPTRDTYEDIREVLLHLALVATGRIHGFANHPPRGTCEAWHKAACETLDDLASGDLVPGSDAATVVASGTLEEVLSSLGIKAEDIERVRATADQMVRDEVPS